MNEGWTKWGNIRGAIANQVDLHLAFKKKQNNLTGGTPSTSPSTAGLNGQVLTTNGAGQLSWATSASGVTDHALLSHLTYATAGHTGFEQSGAATTAVANHVTAYHSSGEFQQTTVAGAINGVNTTYTLGHALAEPIFIIWNGVKQLSITSYTITSTTLEMAVAPGTGDSLEAYGKY